MDKIDIVLPDGSMMEKIMDLFLRAGMPITLKSKRTKEAIVDSKFIGRIVFQRPQEIPELIEKGLFDAGFVGQDWIKESMVILPKLLSLPMGRKLDAPVKIVLAARQRDSFKHVDDLPPNCRVATEYVKLAKNFFYEKGRPDIQVIASYGNTEHKIGLGLADAIVDVVESGESLKENGLEIVQEIMDSNIVLAANPNSYADQNKRLRLKHLAKIINGAFQASRHVLLVANAPKELQKKASNIMAGLKGPTRSKLVYPKGWVALQSVVLRENEESIIYELDKIGVEDIFVIRDIPMLMMKRPAIL